MCLKILIKYIYCNEKVSKIFKKFFRFFLINFENSVILRFSAENK